MSLCAPNVVGALSPLSTSVRLCNQIVNADVVIYRNGTPIGRQTAVASDQIFDFFPGTTLNAGDSVTASQELNGDASPQTPVPTQVQHLTPPFSGHRFVSHVYQCGTSLFLAGIVPGADFTLTPGDEVDIRIDGVGTLTNPVIRVGR